MIESQALVDAVVSHAMTTGYFAKVNQYEPKSTPQSDMTCAVWLQSMRPMHSSGLASTSSLVTMNVRLYTNMLQDPPDMIDPTMMEAVDALMTAYSGDFTLDGLVRSVDLLGMEGEPLGGAAGYVQIGQGEGSMFRVFTITVPLMINDSWEQVA